MGQKITHQIQSFLVITYYRKSTWTAHTSAKANLVRIQSPYQVCPCPTLYLW